jgi:ABC-type sugar transport system ATPase subunit
VLREGRTVADLEKREISEERIIAAMAHGPGEAEASQEQGGV